jgi:hypothetical protein
LGAGDYAHLEPNHSADKKQCVMGCDMDEAKLTKREAVAVKNRVYD